MAERINKDAFIANILECFTLLQTYEECYKEILDIIDVINGLNESDLTVENLQKLVEGSEYISLDINEAGTKLVISLDRTHVDETVKEDSTNLVTSGAVFDAVANANGNVLRLPINVPTEPLVVMIGTNNAQTNIPLGDGLAVVNNHLVATGGGGGGGISPSEANTFTAKQTFSGGIVSTKPATADDELTTLAQMKNSNLGNQAYTNTKFNTLNDQLVATNTEVSKKLDKMTGTGDGVKVYINQGETDRLLNATSDKTRSLIVMWDKLAQLHANAGTTDDAVVNLKQLNDAIAGVSGADVTKSYVDEQDTKLQENIDKKLSKATSTSGTYAYARNGVNDTTITIDADNGTGYSLVRRNASKGITVSGISCSTITASSWLIINGNATFSSEVVCNTTLITKNIQINSVPIVASDYTAGAIAWDMSSGGIAQTALFMSWKYTYDSTIFTERVCLRPHYVNANSYLITQRDLNPNQIEFNKEANYYQLKYPVVKCTQTEYEVLTKDANTLYVIVG